jgi:hypothetical protein
MTILQQWLAGLIGLGALYLVAKKDSSIATSIGAAQKFFSGTEHTALTGQA